MENQKLTIPYASFTTWKGAVDSLKPEDLLEVITLKDIEDKLTRSQILNAFRVFHLINNDGDPTPILRQRVRKELPEDAWYNNLLNNLYYPYILGNDISLMTFERLKKLFENGNFGVSGQTAERAVNFFLRLMEAAGRELPEHLIRKRGRPKNSAVALDDNSRSRLTIKSPSMMANNRTHVEGRRATYRREENGEKEDLTQATTRTIKLKGGGDLALSLSVNLFDLAGRDREFVFDLIDRLKAYQAEIINPKILEEIK